MTKKMLFIFNPHSGKGQIKNHLLDILDKFAKAEYDITVRPTPVSYTHLDVYKRQVVTNAQYKTYVISKSPIISVVDKSTNNSTGNVTTKLNLFAVLTNPLFRIPICFRTYPTTITRNTGSVALRL